MRTLIHDLKEEELKKLNFDEEDRIISVRACNNRCIGCFSCWIKHPTNCIYKDDYSNIVESIKNSDELIIVSKSRYGCYSNEIKKVLERIIGYILPYFTIREGKIHHKSRYDERIKLTAYFYGDIDDKDKICLNNLVKANAINFNASTYEVKYLEET